MIIKTFRAETNSMALKRVKEEMGGEAIVLKTTQSVGANNRPIFEITACIENPTVAQSSRLLATPSVEETAAPKNETVTNNTAADSNTLELNEKIRELESKLEQIIAPKLETVSSAPERIDINDLFINGDFDFQTIKELKEKIDGSDSENLSEHLIKAFENAKATPIEFKAGDRIIFFGPAGAGKSLVMGKLTAELVARKKQKVKLHSLDDMKMAAYDELAAYADILGTELGTVYNEISFDGDKINLIDTPALKNDSDSLARLADKIESVEADYRFLVLSALIRSVDVSKICQKIKNFNPTHLIITKTDLTESYGSILSAVRASGLKVLYVADSSNGIEQLKQLDPNSLCEKLMNYEVSGEPA